MNRILCESVRCFCLKYVLINFIQASEACGSIEIDSALEGVRSLADDLDALEKSADEGKLLPLPGESVRLYFKLQFINVL